MSLCLLPNIASFIDTPHLVNIYSISNDAWATFEGNVGRQYYIQKGQVLATWDKINVDNLVVYKEPQNYDKMFGKNVCIKTHTPAHTHAHH